MKKSVYVVLGFSLLFLGFNFMISSIVGDPTSLSPPDSSSLQPISNTTSGIIGVIFLVLGILSLNKLRERKRGQAAMEFLMTYGWAILAAIIAIGVLAYFGVFESGEYVGSSAFVTAPFYAEGWNVDPSQVHLEIRNDGAETLTIRDVTLTDLEGTISCTPTGDQGPIEKNEQKVIDIDCTGLTAGEPFKADISILYTKQNSNLPLSSTGTVTSTVTEASNGGGGPTEFRVFLTSDNSITGISIGGVSGANTICNDLATTAGLGGNWEAWISDDTISPSTEFYQGTEDYVLLDGTVVANGWSDLTDGTLDNPINKDESGDEIFSDLFAWTGTDFDGSSIESSNCNEWTGNSEQGIYGDVDDLTQDWWTNRGSTNCQFFQTRIYCFEQP